MQDPVIEIVDIPFATCGAETGIRTATNKPITPVIIDIHPSTHGNIGGVDIVGIQ